MKFDPFKWQEATTNEIEFTAGRLQLRASQISALYIEAEGHEVLHSVGTSWDVTISETVTAKVIGPEGTRVFFYNPADVNHQSYGRILTNIDRKPNESGAVQAVNAGLRQLELAKRQTLREIQQATRRLERAELRNRGPKQRTDPQEESEVEQPANPPE